METPLPAAKMAAEISDSFNEKAFSSQMVASFLYIVGNLTKCVRYGDK